jgi:hypothetical protein
VRTQDWGKAEDAIMKAQTASPESIEAKYRMGKYYLAVSLPPPAEESTLHRVHLLMRRQTPREGPTSVLLAAA